MPEPPEAGRDVKGDVIIALPTWKPRPLPVGELEFSDLGQQPLRLIVQAIIFKKHSYILPGLALGHGLTEPRCFFEHYTLEVLIFLERTVQGGCGAPLLEHSMNLWIGVCDRASKGICIEPVEGLFCALVRELHEVRKSHDRIPGWVRDHLHSQALVLQRVRFPGPEQFAEFKPPGAW